MKTNRNQSSDGPGQSGFTLIELLSVIAIIAARLVPALARANAQARRGTRLDNGIESVIFWAWPRQNTEPRQQARRDLNCCKRNDKK